MFIDICYHGDLASLKKTINFCDTENFKLNIAC